LGDLPGTLSYFDIPFQDAFPATFALLKPHFISCFDVFFSFGAQKLSCQFVPKNADIYALSLLVHANISLGTPLALYEVPADIAVFLTANAVSNLICLACAAQPSAKRKVWAHFLRRENRYFKIFNSGPGLDPGQNSKHYGA